MIFVLIGPIIFIGAFLLSAFVYEKIGFGKRFFHDVLKWHEPTDYQYYDGCNWRSKCKHCGKDITRDSQNNWF